MRRKTPHFGADRELYALSGETGAPYASRYATSIVLVRPDAQAESTALAIQIARSAVQNDHSILCASPI